MSMRTPNVHNILDAAVNDFEVDDLAIMREGWRRFEKELAATIVGFGRLGASAREGSSGPTGYYVLLDRLEALGDLHRTLRAAGPRINVADSVADVCLTLGRCSSDRVMPPIEMDLADVPIDGRVARGISLMIVALLAGETAGGPIRTTGHVELEVGIGPASIEVSVRDLCSDPPDRIQLGGALLRRTAEALGARIGGSSSPGLATVTISVPCENAQPFRTAGHA